MSPVAAIVLVAMAAAIAWALPRPAGLTAAAAQREPTVARVSKLGSTLAIVVSVLAIYPAAVLAAPCENLSPGEDCLTWVPIVSALIALPLSVLARVLVAAGRPFQSAVVLTTTVAFGAWAVLWTIGAY